MIKTKQDKTIMLYVDGLTLHVTGFEKWKCEGGEGWVSLFYRNYYIGYLKPFSFYRVGSSDLLAYKVEFK